MRSLIDKCLEARQEGVSLFIATTADRLG
jgi:hypothetical protein